MQQGHAASKRMVGQNGRMGMAVDRGQGKSTYAVAANVVLKKPFGRVRDGRSKVKCYGKESTLYVWSYYLACELGSQRATFPSSMLSLLPSPSPT